MSRDLFGAALGFAALSVGSSSILGSDLRSYPWSPSRIDDSQVTHTPKPLSKRAKRRLRGKQQGASA